MRPPNPRVGRTARRLFTLALRLYPRRFRERFGDEMMEVFERDFDDPVGPSPSSRRSALWTLRRVAANGVRARMESWRTEPEGEPWQRPRRRRASEYAGDVVLPLRHAVRTLRRSPTFTATAILTLGLGLGACTTIFAVTYPALLAPLAYPEADRLVSVYEKSPAPEGQIGWTSPLTFRDWRERADRFEGLAAWRLSVVTWTGAGEPRIMRGWAVSAEFFRLLGLEMRLGRGFTPEEDDPGGERVLVLSHGLWAQDFGSDPAALGRVITLDGLPYTIVGVAHASVDFPGGGDFYTPLGIDYGAEARDFRYLGVLGRLRRGSTLEEANEELRRISRQLAGEYPETNAGWSAEATSLKDDLVGYARPVLLGMSAAVGLLLLIALGNVGNLSLGRGVRRRTERAVRRALGASHGDLARLLLAEGVILSMAGAALGVGLAYVGIQSLSDATLGLLPRPDAVGLDFRALMFAAGTAVSAGLALGLFSLMGARGGRLADEIRAGGGGTTPATRVHRVREGVLTTQVALALALLIGASILVQSLVALSRVDVGFDPEGVLAFSFDLPKGSYGDPATVQAFYREALGAIRAAPGIEAAGAVTPLPMELGSVPSLWTLPEADPSDPPLMVHMRTATPGYLEAMRIPVRRGRAFGSDDVDGSASVALVNEAFVRKYLAGREPLGSRVTADGADAADADWLTVVGVVGDVRFRSLRTPAEPEIYLPAQQLPTPWGHLVVRTRLGERDAAREVASAVHEADPDLPLGRVLTGEHIVGRQLATTRLSVALSSVFAAAAGALALVGMLGVLSITLAQRRREIGVRLLLGAPPRSIRWFALGRIWTSVSIGLLVGILLSLAASRVLQSQVFEVRAADPATFSAATLAFAGVSFLACLLSALRTGAVDPVTLLRSE